MLKFIVGLLISIVVLDVHAKTQIQFFGVQGMVSLITPKTGTGDNDAQALYDQLDIPPRDSNLGPGKAFKTPAKELNLVCSNSKAQGYICTMVLNRSPNTVLTADRMIYEVSGPAADDLLLKFIRDTKGEFHFVTQDRLFEVDAQVGHFLLMYNAKGVP